MKILLCGQKFKEPVRNMQHFPLEKTNILHLMTAQYVVAAEFFSVIGVSINYAIKDKKVHSCYAENICKT